MEKTENVLIEKNQVLQKKEIIVPIKKENYKLSIESLNMKKILMQNHYESNLGYYHQYENKIIPNPESYEPDDQDISFLIKLFPKYNKILSNPIIKFDIPIIQEFCDAIKYIDKSRDYDLKFYSYQGSNLGKDELQQIVNLWKEKTKFSKYPLLRKFWKKNIKKAEFGELDPLRVAYRDREKERMRLRKVLKYTDKEIYEKMEKLVGEMKIAISLTNMTILREKLKMISLKISFSIDFKEQNALLNEYENISLSLSNLLSQADKYQKQYSPIAQSTIQTKTVKQEHHPKDKTVDNESQTINVVLQNSVENEVNFFISSVLGSLKQYGFELSDFKTENLRILNEKIWKINRENQIGISVSERILNTNKENIQDEFSQSFQKLSFLRCPGYSNPFEQFLEKLSYNKNDDKKMFYDSDNFVNDHLVKRTIDTYSNEFSGFRCGLGNNFSSGYLSNIPINSKLESVLLKKYDKYFENMPSFEQDINDKVSSVIDFENYNSNPTQTYLSNLAQLELEELSIESKFRKFMMNKRIK